MYSQRNLVGLLEQNVFVRPEKPALFDRTDMGYAAITYQEVWNKTIDFGLGLTKQFRLRQGDHVALLSENRSQWVISDLGIMACGCVNVPIYPTLTAQEMKNLLDDCKPRLVIVSNPIECDKILSILGYCDYIESIIVMDSVKNSHNVFSFDQIQDIGRNASDKDRNKFLTTIRSIKPDTLASIVYTSGTTGKSKGVMLTHGNFLANVDDVVERFLIDENDSVLSFLPLSHVFERTVGYYVLLAIGGSIYYAQSIQTVSEDMQVAKPTVIICVPRLFEKTQSKLLTQLRGIKKLIFRFAQKVGRHYYQLPQNQKPSFWLRLGFFFAYRLVLSKVHQKMGGHIRFCVSGGAPLSKGLADFFFSLGLTIIEGYGLTETSPVISCNTLDAYEFGTVGTALKNVQTKISEDGELWVKGPSVMKGYYQDASTTAEAISRDGWFCTGDIVTINDQGFIRIVDRKKDLIVLSNGKNVAPQPIELELSSSRFILQAVVIGEGRNYLTALIVPNYGLLNSYCRTKAEVHRLFEKVIQRKTKGSAPYKQIKKFRVLETELTPDNGELTATLKVKRHVINERYQNIIGHMYEEKQ